MNTLLSKSIKAAKGISPKARRRIAWTVAIVVILQMYFVRELIAAELLFGMLFAVMFALASICYLVGTVGTNGREWAEAGIRLAADAARRNYYDVIDEISKKSFRHPHSESAR
jgi:hypothetical protein